MKILLIMPGGRKGLVWAVRPWVAPGGIVTLAGMTPEHHHVSIWSELAHGTLTEENLPEADLYGISGLTSTRFEAYRIARMIRKRGKKVVAGGFDVTGHYRDDPENNGKEQLSFFDAILIGRGTPPVWQQILTDFERASLGQV